MKNRTVRVIIILVGLLILNIEAAHAGITHKFRVFIRQELSDFQLLYMSGGLAALGFLSYVIFMPAFKEKGKMVRNQNYFHASGRHTYQKRRGRIKKIHQILKNMEAGN